MADDDMTTSPPLNSELYKQIVAVTGPSGVLTGTDASSRSCDPLCITPTLAGMIVRPADIEQLARVISLCARFNQPMVVQGGRTGVAGGAYSEPDDVVISLERMNKIEDICVASQTAVVQAGVTIEALQNAVQAQGLFYPIDLGSKGTATLGGTIATNAGGNRVIRWGMTRQNILGIEAVLADGTLVSSLGRLLKNNTGYDLKHLFIGSEGTFGVVSRAVVKLVPLPSTHYVAFVSVASFDKVVALLARARRLPILSAFEVMWSDFYSLVAPDALSKGPVAPGQPYYILIEGLGYNETADQMIFNEFLEEALASELMVDAVVAASEKQCQDFWRVREGTEAIVREMSPFIAFDVSVEIPCVEAYLSAVREALCTPYPEARFVTFGHLGDNNIHLGITVGPHTHEVAHHIEQLVYAALPRFGGAITAEHGIGQFKKAFMKEQKSSGEKEVMRRMRAAMDPARLINREVMF
ncbi:MULTISPECIES: FAD-binding oxidoreductase [unclassified Pseudomonas]|uniref:FAD-binding oxidoreductase n=1 Tax=unclassified Pseudomonas TaxID=196821 RepID=UPI000871663C|nr:MULTISPECIES: FAD-binding oxidoreductase [unclassified Pseudomonas]SCW99104.1 FAD/FMN-containing dehydrogenase [Pseudomonas sp. NFACC56-3]SFK87975.1 FAD/FMN-containing dehydrogenase [Pseudomonas sp. NFACC52]